jgi:hypothetical protein
MRENESVSNGPCSPVHELGIIGVWEHATILLWLSLRLRLSHLWKLLHNRCLSWVYLLLLLQPSSLLLLTTLPLLSVVYQECQYTCKREYNERFQYLGVNVIVRIIGVAAGHRAVTVIVVVRLEVVVPACDLCLKDLM